MTWSQHGDAQRGEERREERTGTQGLDRPGRGE